MNKSSIVAPDATRKGLIRPISAGISSEAQNARDSKEKFQNKNSSLPIRLAKRSNALRTELSESGGFCMFPLELCKRKWPSSRLRIFAFIVGQPDSRIISIRDVMEATEICPSVIKQEISNLCMNGYLSPQSVTIRTRNGVRKMTTWDVNSRSKWVDSDQAGDPDTPNPPGRGLGYECNDTVEPEAALEAESTKLCQIPQAEVPDTPKEEGEKTKNIKPERKSDPSTAPHIWQAIRILDKPKSHPEKKSVAKEDLVGLMRALYNQHAPTLAIKGCVALLIGEFDRSVILSTLLRYADANRPSMKWGREDLQAWRFECRQTFNAREITLAANG